MKIKEIKEVYLIETIMIGATASDVFRSKISGTSGPLTDYTFVTDPKGIFISKNGDARYVFNHMVKVINPVVEE